MKLYEYEGKRILQSVGVNIPEGKIISTPGNAKQFATELGGKTILKAQVLATGRGKVGGVKIATSPLEAEQIATSLLGTQIKGYQVEKLLVEEALDIKKEIYVGLTYDERTKGRLLLASESGGMDINEVAEKTPDKVKKVRLGSWIGLQPFQSRELAFELDLSGTQNTEMQSILLKLWDVFETYDANLVEINPLVITQDGRVVVADAHIRN